MNNKILSCL